MFYVQKSLLLNGLSHLLLLDKTTILTYLLVYIDLSTAQRSKQLQQLDTNNTTDLTQASGEKVMLQTAIVLIQSSDGKLVKARILLDMQY